MFGAISPNFSDLVNRDPNDFTKVVEVRITCEDGRGNKITKTLRDKSAKRWHKWLIGVCQFSYLHSANPPWQSLEWEIKNG